MALHRKQRQSCNSLRDNLTRSRREGGEVDSGRFPRAVWQTAHVPPAQARCTLVGSATVHLWAGCVFLRPVVVAPLLVFVSPRRWRQVRERRLLPRCPGWIMGLYEMHFRISPRLPVLGCTHPLIPHQVGDVSFDIKGRAKPSGMSGSFSQLLLFSPPCHTPPL